MVWLELSAKSHHYLQIKEEIGRHIHKARQFSMSSLSPYLAECRESSIPMPGLPIFDSLVKIGTFDNVIIGLPTKTKPKKITIMSSNGRKYPYLLKGLEDLHLDERVMQFVNTVNTLLQIDKETQKRQLQSRAYAVIPFGDHFGMIQWVNDMTPMFSFYKKWMSSTGASAVAATAATTSTSGGGGKNGTSSSKKNKAATTAAAAVVVASRPNESFYIKVKEALKQLRLAKNTPRKNWPLKKIFAELVEETPDYLFENELRCSSATPHIWYQKSQR